MSLSQVVEWKKATKGVCTQVRPLSILLNSFPITRLTAMRQTWEEIGLDLAERDYTCIGQLDDREITTSLGKRLLMILSPFVFLQLTPHSLPTDPVPATTLHWTPLASLVSPSSSPQWSTVTVDAATRLVSKHSTALRLLIRVLVGSMQFPAIIVEPSPSSDSNTNSAQHNEENGIPPSIFTDKSLHQNLKLWGLSLGMTLDLMSYMIAPSTSSDFKSASSSLLSPLLRLPYQSSGNMRVDVVAPSLASVFPRFSYPDVNFWIWCVSSLKCQGNHLPIVLSFYVAGSLENAIVKLFVAGRQVYVLVVLMTDGRLRFYYHFPFSPTRDAIPTE